MTEESNRRVAGRLGRAGEGAMKTIGNRDT